jgi:hypothetical protein
MCSFGNEVFTLDNAALYGLQSLADNPPYCYILSLDVYTVELLILKGSDNDILHLEWLSFWTMFII